VHVSSWLCRVVLRCSGFWLLYRWKALRYLVIDISDYVHVLQTCFCVALLALRWQCSGAGWFTIWRALSGETYTSPEELRMLLDAEQAPYSMLAACDHLRPALCSCTDNIGLFRQGNIYNIVSYMDGMAQYFVGSGAFLVPTLLLILVIPDLLYLFMICPCWIWPRMARRTRHVAQHLRMALEYISFDSMYSICTICVHSLVMLGLCGMYEMSWACVVQLADRAKPRSSHMFPYR
jgi:hypothetical protein